MQTQYELDLVAAAYEQYGQSYAMRRLNGGMLFNDYIEAPVIRKLLGPVRRLRGIRALDIGCGPGVYSNLLLRAGASVLGVDSSSVMLEATRSYCGRSQGDGERRARFLLSSFELADFGGEQFDVVLATFMLSYFDDLTAAFVKMKKHLAPRGRILTSMLHPIRLFSSEKSKDGYVVSNYFSGGVYKADFLAESASLPLKRYNFEDLCAAARAANLIITDLLEPRASVGCGFADEEKVEFYSRNPSIVVLQLTAR